MRNNLKILALSLLLLAPGCASYKPPLQAPLPPQVPAPPPELMTPPEQESWSAHALEKFKLWLRYLTNEINSL
jgi:hypothetical protein